MKIDLTQQLTDFDGVFMRDRFLRQDEEGQVVLDEQGHPEFDSPAWTLRRVFEQSLLAPELEFDERTGREILLRREDKIRMYHLARKVHDSDGTINLEPEDVTLIKSLINLKFPKSPLMVGLAFDAIDPPEKPTEQPPKSSGEQKR